MIPAINGSANSRMEDTPMMNRTNTITKVVRDVLMLRVKVWVILVFTISTV